MCSTRGLRTQGQNRRKKSRCHKARTVKNLDVGSVKRFPEKKSHGSGRVKKCEKKTKRKKTKEQQKQKQKQKSEERKERKNKNANVEGRLVYSDFLSAPSLFTNLLSSSFLVFLCSYIGITLLLWYDLLHLPIQLILLYLYIYIYRERESERERDRDNFFYIYIYVCVCVCIIISKLYT